MKIRMLFAKRVLLAMGAIFILGGCANSDLDDWQRYGYKPVKNIEKHTSYEHGKIYRTKIKTIMQRDRSSYYSSWHMHDWPKLPGKQEFKGNMYQQLPIGVFARLEGVYTRNSQTVGPIYIIVFELIDQHRNPIDVPWSKFILDYVGNPFWRTVSPETGEVSDEVFEEVAP